MENQFKAGEFIVYDTYGVCEITEIKKMSLVSKTSAKLYYVLVPVNSKSSVYYIPCDNDILCARMRKPMSAEEIEQLLNLSEEVELKWTENRQARAERSREILKNGITPSLIALIRCYYNRKFYLREKGKPFAATDEAVLSSCEKLIYEEFSFSLGLPQESVPEYIRGLMAEN